MIVGWAAGVGAGAWVLADPPQSYSGLGLGLTIAWGVMLAVGSGLVTVGHVLRRYRIELPGLVLALGGVAIYAYLSWVQTLTESPGSGPRPMLLILLAAFIIARARALLHIDRQLRRLADMRNGA